MARPGFIEGLAHGRAYVPVAPAEADVHEEVCVLIASGRFDAAPFVSARFSPEEHAEAWRQVQQKIGVKAAIVF